MLTYQPVWNAGFIWDDNFHVTAPELRSPEGLGRIWGELGATQQYYPLLHSAFWLQFRLWGDAPAGYHLVNLLMHIAASGLLLLVLRRLAIPGALFAAAIFALHPVQVESVAWITELKNTLSGVFFFGALLAYLKYYDNRRLLWYTVASGLFALALLSKTVTAVLPGVLLVIFWWQHGRLSWRREVAPLAPWFAVGAGMGLLTAWVERTLIGAEGARFALDGIERVLLAGRVVWFYLGKLFWPANLMFSYPRWEISRSETVLFLFPAAALALTAGLWWIRKRTRAPLAGFLIFVGCLFPVLGFFNVYPFIFSFVADHFQYLAAAGIIVPVAAGLDLGTRPMSRGLRHALAITLLATLSVLTWRQARLYRDAETLYRATLVRNPASSMIHNNLGNALARSGRADEAIGHYEEALRLEPGYWDAHYNLGNALLETGRPSEAIGEYESALRLRSDNPAVHNNLGRALLLAGRSVDAILHFQKTLRLSPDHTGTHQSLGIALVRSGRLPEAIPPLEQALRLGPRDARMHALVGTLLAQSGRADEAIRHYEQALQIEPRDAVTHSNLGGVLAETNQLEEAVAHFEAALQLNPAMMGAHHNLGNVLALLGRTEEAIRHYEEAVRLDPEASVARRNLERARALQQK
jgi:protein O-mannosyl-transferase